MKKCVECGALNQDVDMSCGVCGGSFTGLRTAPQATAVTARRVHVRGFIQLIVGLVIVVSGILLMGTAAATLGFFVLFLGVAWVGSVIGMFRGLPYQPNSGWHSGGDPDLAATATRGAKPANYRMLEVDRDLSLKEKEEEND